jgi:hypothetical protein
MGKLYDIIWENYRKQTMGNKYGKNEHVEI